MAIAVVQSQGTLTYSGSNTSGDPTRTDNKFSSAVTTGNAVVVIEWISNSWGASPPTTGAVTDNKGNTYHQVFSLTTTNTQYRGPEVLQMYVAYNVTGGSSFSTISNASSYSYCCCGTFQYPTLPSSMVSYEISGLGSSNPIDTYSTNQGSYLSNPSSGSITNSPNAILIGCAGLDSNNAGGPAITWTSTSGFTGPISSPPPTGSAVAIPLGTEYKIVSSSGSYSSSMTAPSSGAAFWYAKAIASFKVGVTNPHSSFMAFF